METFSALLAICAGISPVPGEFPTQRQVTRSFDVYFDLRLNKRLGKQSWGSWFETLLCPLWRHSNGELACRPFDVNLLSEAMIDRLLPPGHLVADFGDISIKLQSIPFRKLYSDVSSANRRPFHSGLNSPPRGQNGRHFADYTFRWIFMYFDSNFIEVCSLGANLQ